ncbi:hypothetical protein PTKU64_39260 [Paraburkholderia terrae]|uniref:Tyr recombinase domain-containing protein n=1 Tax=Paraburkholderia terrae TaxID=311230 RepID=A0ABN6JHN3_9BURK|nr:hypothetical protein PTKU64_39260 [Paraburkholderia terrae]BDC41282.1 hypothetical protein PTKU15_45790 [Paraburkholderia terrae]
MVRRRALAAGIGTAIGKQTLRATGITACLKNGDALENAAAMANHASRYTTHLYARRHADISLDEVEWIHLQTGVRMGMLIPHLDQVAPNAAQTRRPASGERTGGPETVKGQDLTAFLSEGTSDTHLLLTLTPCCGAVFNCSKGSGGPDKRFYMGTAVSCPGLTAAP